MMCMYLVWHSDLEELQTIFVPLLYHSAQLLVLFPRYTSSHGYCSSYYTHWRTGSSKTARVSVFAAESRSVGKLEGYTQRVIYKARKLFDAGFILLQVSLVQRRGRVAS